jgi:hypothetical protein
LVKKKGIDFDEIFSLMVKMSSIRVAFWFGCQNEFGDQIA